MKKYFCDVCGTEIERGENAAGPAAELCGFEDLCPACGELARNLDAAELVRETLRRLAAKRRADGEKPPEGPVPPPSRTDGPALMGRYAKEKRSILAMLRAYREERGPGCLTELAQRAHVAESELRDMLECGKVPYSIWLAVGRALGK